MCENKARSASSFVGKQISGMVGLIGIFLVVLSACDAKVVTDTCTTPDSKEGLCIPLQECPSIFAMSNDLETPLTIERLNFLINSQCGYVKSNPNVCCSMEEVLKQNETKD